jgi:hypothetical protein
MFMVGLNGLRGYQANQDPRSLLIDKQEVMYPLVSAGEVKSSVTVRQHTDGSWEAVQFGRVNVAKDADAGRVNVAAKSTGGKGSVDFVEIPTLSSMFLAHDKAGSLMLTPLHDVPGTALRAQQSYPASEVFAVLQPLAANVSYGNQ